MERLRRMLEQDRLPHALLFAGPSGIGKRIVAEIFAAHDCIYLSYEDLVVNSTGCYAEILKFLGLAPQELVEPFRPGTLTPETTKVVNAASVRRFLARSIWADYLDTCPLV